MTIFRLTQAPRLPFRTIRKFVNWLPFLWSIGILIPVSAILVLTLTYRAIRARPQVSTTAGLWIVVACLQALSVCVNWYLGNFGLGYLFYRMLSAAVVGWLFLGLALNIGQRFQMASAYIIRCAGILSIFVFVGCVSAIAFAYITGIPSVEISGPIGIFVQKFAPASVQTSLINNFTARWYIPDDSGVIPRVVLFYPWSTCLGFSGLALLFICSLERGARWRIFGMLGGVVGIVASLSRTVGLATLVAFAVYLFIRTTKGMRIAMVAGSVALLSVLSLGNAGLRGNFTSAANQVNALRQGSSDARMLVYDASWRAFIKSPYIGYGWTGELIDENIEIAMGSHSTVFGVLYTGGSMVAAGLVLAIIGTFIGLWRSHQPRTHKAVALSIFAALCVVATTEGICTFVLPNLLVFIWLGGALSSPLAIVTRIGEHIEVESMPVLGSECGNSHA